MRHWQQQFLLLLLLPPTRAAVDEIMYTTHLKTFAQLYETVKFRKRDFAKPSAMMEHAMGQDMGNRTRGDKRKLAS